MDLSIWNEEFWLPKNTTWKDFNQLEQNGIRVPRIPDLLFVYPLAGIIYIARLLFEYYIAQPLGRSLGIGDSQSNIQGIDQKFKQSNSSDNKRRQQRRIRVGPLAKFSESTWRFTFYFSIFLYGVIILKNVRLKKKKNKTKIFFYFLRKFGSGIHVIVG
jgi:ceramide synthetase